MIVVKNALLKKAKDMDEGLPGCYTRGLLTKVANATNETVTMTEQQFDVVLSMVEDACNLKKTDAVLQVPVISTYINTFSQPVRW